jgi:hypothetical protein
MKVYIGPYRDWIGPYQIAEKILFWMDKDKDDRVHNFGTWLAGGDKGDSLLMKFCNWVEKHKKRKVQVRIDNYDTWSMDHTLALMVLPMLKQLQATKHGAPFVDDEDVPEELRSTSAPPKENEWDTDANHFKRWDWVLDEMIQAFECKCNDGWDDVYWTGEWGDTIWEDTGEEIHNPITDKVEKTFTMKHTGNRTCNWEALEAHGKRNKNGFRLFGKYYEALWD